jgi:murein DD-endopeptidase / murein LD-carboxypeptidase
LIELAQYIGIPWRDRGRDRAGCDCYGLVWMVLREQCGIELPSYAADYATAADQIEIARMLAGECAARGEAVTAGQENRGDLIMLRIGRHECHVGLVVNPRLMLNVRRGVNSCLERYDAPMWRERVAGFWRPLQLGGEVV